MIVSPSSVAAVALFGAVLMPFAPAADAPASADAHRRSATTGIAAQGALEPPDSATILNDAQERMRAYLLGAQHSAELGRSRNLPVENAEIQEERLELIEALDEAAVEIPGDDWIVGHRVGLRIKAGRVEDAARVAGACRGSEWWCGMLEGFALHVAGDSLEAHLAYDRGLANMHPEERCEWQAELGEILVGSLRGRYRGAECEPLDELARRVWWLADPFHLLPWNDWRSEHLTRVIGMRLHHQSHDLVGRRCSNEHHMQVLLEGWPDWWWGYDRGRWTPPPPSHQFLPPSGVAERPLEARAQGWDLIEDPYLERMELGYDIIHDMEEQTAFFARGDSILVVASSEMDRHLMRGEPSLTTGIALSTGPASPRWVATTQGPPEHVHFRLTAPRDAYLVSVEAIADTWGAARIRFGHRLPEPGTSGIGVSDIVLFDWSANAGENVDDVLPRMLGTRRLATDREIGIFWEMYGAEEGDPLELSLRVLDTEEGFFRRIGRALGVAGRNAAVRTSWSEIAGDGEDDGVRGRSLRLDLSALDPGHYLIELVVRGAEDAEAAVVRREVEVDWR